MMIESGFCWIYRLGEPICTCCIDPHVITDHWYSQLTYCVDDISLALLSDLWKMHKQELTCRGPDKRRETRMHTPMASMVSRVIPNGPAFQVKLHIRRDGSLCLFQRWQQILQVPPRVPKRLPSAIVCSRSATKHHAIQNRSAANNSVCWSFD